MNLEVVAAVASDPKKLIINLADIFIVSYACYRLLLIIRGTRAEQLLKGVMVLLGFSAISRWLGFSAANWLVNKVWTGIFIALPIVFQPELRRALEQLGRGRLFPIMLTEKSTELELQIEEVVQATAELSKQKIGALIVWLRETGLEDYADKGVILDAAISAELLKNVFTPNTPLHDGALIISSGRIQRAAAFLPLSDNPRIDKQLGTRHRAAIGISEVSDALVIIVSEETGTIAMAANGKLARPMDEQMLRNQLMEGLSDKNHRRQSIWRKRGNQDEE